MARRFFVLFRENFLLSLAVGAVWLGVCAVLAADFYLVGQMEALRRPLLVVLVLLAVLHALASAFLFPVMVHYETGWRGVLKNCVLLAFARPLTAVQCLLVVGVAAFAVVSLRITLLVAGSAAACAVYFFCHRAFPDARTTGGVQDRE